MTEHYRTAMNRQELRRKLATEFQNWRWSSTDPDVLFDRIMDLVEEYRPWAT